MVAELPQMYTKEENSQTAKNPAQQQTMIRPNVSTYVPIRPAPNGPTITHFQPSVKTQNTQPVYEEFATDDYCVDRESVHRKFGWGMLGAEHHLPFIYRNGEKYCAVRMVDKYIFDNYLAKISDNIYLGCTNILGYYTTIPESLLLNEINEFHCDNFYGSIPFKQGDVLVKLEDANNFYDFLNVCSNKLFNTVCDVKRCGFMSMNGKSVVPYVIIKDVYYVPLFYFDGMEGIKFKVQSIKGWNLSYLRFCFKLHGIRDEFCKSEDCNVIALDELKQFLDATDTLTEWWPTLVSTNKSLFQPRKVTKHLLKPWHQHPITVLPISTVKYTKAPPQRNVSNNPNVYYRTISHS